MNKRRVIEVPGLHHANPIPLATRIGNLLVSGSIWGAGEDLESQCEGMFGNIRRIMEAAGGSTDDIIRLTVWLRDISDKNALNREWLRMFPDEESRPARRTAGDPNMAGGRLVQCEIMAVVGSSGAVVGTDAVS
jgi:enamine deaminase RidA (YjgF/YER057c/UK114 family)